MSFPLFKTYNVIVVSVYVSRELSLPDISMVHGRLLVSAWESGLRDVTDNAVKLVMKSVEVNFQCSFF